MKEKQLSWVWQYFKPTDVGGVRFNVCHAPATDDGSEFCLKGLKPDKSGGTKSMGNHLERKHKLTKDSAPVQGPLASCLAGPSKSSVRKPGPSKPSVHRRLSRESLSAAVARFLVAASLSPETVERAEFIELLRLGNPAVSKSIRLKADGMAQYIQHSFEHGKVALKELFRKLESSVSLSCDSSTSQSGHAVFGVTAHWISSEAVLKSMVLAVVQLSGSHSGTNMAAALYKILGDYGLLDKVFTITTDTISSNARMGAELVYLLPGFNPQNQLIGCMARTINQAAELGLQDFQNPDESESYDDVDFARVIMHRPQYNVKTIVARILRLTSLLSQSAERDEAFRRIVSSVTNGEGSGLLTDVGARWNSIYQMLAQAYRIREAIHTFCLREPALTKFNIANDEWDKVAQLCEFLKPLNTAANDISNEKICSMFTAAPTYSWLLRRLNKALRNYETHELVGSVKQLIGRLEEYCRQAIKRPVHLCAIILDPRIKMTYFEEHSIERVHLSEHEIRAVFADAAFGYSQHPALNAIPTAPISTKTDPVAGSDDDEDRPQLFKKKQRVIKGLEDEIGSYLESECEEAGCDPLAFWKTNAQKFPSLARMAQAYLAAQATCGSRTAIVEPTDSMIINSSAARCSGSKQLGSQLFDNKPLSFSGKNVDPNTLEALVCLKSWITNELVDI